MVQFGYTIVYVDDVEETLAFFKEVFGFNTRFMTDEKDYGELETGSTTLSFASHELGETNFNGGYVSASHSELPFGMELALITDDLRDIHALALKHGAVELKEPTEKPWGQTVSYVRCPSGILIELGTPMAH